jgi:hypothetical protein
MRSSHFVPFLQALSTEKQIRLNGFATLRIIKKSDKKHFKDCNFIESRYLPDNLVVAVRIAPTIGDYCGMVFTRDDDDDESTKTTTKTTSSLKKNGGGTLMLG